MNRQHLQANHHNQPEYRYSLVPNYTIWFDYSASWSQESFDTLEGAVMYAEMYRHPTHAKRIYMNDDQIVTVLPRYTKKGI